MLRRTFSMCPSAGFAVGAVVFSAPALSQSSGFYLVGDTDGTNQSDVGGFSQDGLFAVGRTSSTNPVAPFERAFRWTPEGGRVDASDAGLWRFHTFHRVSSDGTVASGAMSMFSDWSDRRAIVARVGQPVQVLPLLPGWPKITNIVVISGDGQVVAGTCRANGAPASQLGFRWTAAGGIQAIPYPRVGHNFMTIKGISRDGSTIVGDSASLGAGVTVAFRWRAATGSQELPSPLSQSTCHGVSANGDVVVGRFSGQSGTRAARWDASLVVHDLGTINASTSNEARCVSDDGLTIGGFAGQSSGSTWRATVWTPASGIVLADDFFAAHGVPLPAEHTSVVLDEISGNGLSFGFRFRRPGQDANRSAIIILGLLCPADFNSDGGIDGADVDAFFQAWETGSWPSDVNHDGGVDGLDVQVFFEAWESGGCE